VLKEAVIQIPLKPLVKGHIRWAPGHSIGEVDLCVGSQGDRVACCEVDMDDLQHKADTEQHRGKPADGEDAELTANTALPSFTNPFKIAKAHYLPHISGEVPRAYTMEDFASWD
jgi:hypothetical protein